MGPVAPGYYSASAAPALGKLAATCSRRVHALLWKAKRMRRIWMWKRLLLLKAMMGKHNCLSGAVRRRVIDAAHMPHQPSRREWPVLMDHGQKKKKKKRFSTQDSSTDH